MARGTSDDKSSGRFARQSVSDEPGTYPAIILLTDADIVVSTSGMSGDTVLRVERHPTVR